MEAALTDQPSCFNCDDQGGGIYKPHGVATNWYIGHVGGQGHYACEDCKDLLFDAHPINIPERTIMPRNAITLLLPVDVSKGVSPEEVADIVQKLLDIGLDDAKTTIEEGEGDLDIANQACSLRIHAPSVIELTPTSLDKARLAAVALLAPFLSRGEDGTHPEDALNQTLNELLPRYDATRKRFLTPAQRDVLIRTFVDQKQQWQANSEDEITEVVINGYWGYIDATDELLLERAVGESASLLQANPAYYTKEDVETMRQILVLPETTALVADREDSDDFLGDVESTIQSITDYLDKKQRSREAARP